MKIAFIGLGNMGLPMAINLQKGGFAVTGFDLSADQLGALSAAGGLCAKSATDAVLGADVVITMLPASKHVETVYLGDEGILSKAKPGTLFIDCSTISPEAARTVAAVSALKGFAMLAACRT